MWYPEKYDVISLNREEYGRRFSEKEVELWRNAIATEDQGMMLFSDIFSS